MMNGFGKAPATDAEPCDVDRLTLLGRFEEALVLAAIACGPQATAGAIKSRLLPALGERHINCVLTTLDRLARKGIVESQGKAESTGLKGRRRKTYQVTQEGHQIVRRNMSIFADLAREAGLSEAA